VGPLSLYYSSFSLLRSENWVSNLVSQQEIVSLYQRFCQLDRNAKGFISADEFLSVPEFAMNPLSQVYSSFYFPSLHVHAFSILDGFCLFLFAEAAQDGRRFEF